MSAIEEDLAKIEEGTFRLQKEWERFFSGQERKAPFEAKQRLDRLIRRYLGVEIRNNVERFRFQTLTAKYNTLSDMWNRKLRAIEEGRPLSSSQLKLVREAAAESSRSRRRLRKSRRRTGPATATRSSRPRSVVRLSTLREDDEGVKELYEQFRAARVLGGPAGSEVRVVPETDRPATRPPAAGKGCGGRRFPHRPAGRESGAQGEARANRLTA